METVLDQFATKISHLKNVELTTCTSNPLEIEQAVLLWMRELLVNYSTDVHLVIPGKEEFLSQKTIPCLFVKHIVRMDFKSEDTTICPCHGQPIMKVEKSDSLVEGNCNSVSSSNILAGISDARCGTYRRIFYLPLTMNIVFLLG